jgi:hypothetical protein
MQSVLAKSLHSTTGQLTVCRYRILKRRGPPVHTSRNFKEAAAHRDEEIAKLVIDGVVPFLALPNGPLLVVDTGLSSDPDSSHVGQVVL